MAKKMPKYPKGLKASIAKIERQLAREKAISDRKKDIARLKSKKEQLLKKKRGY